MNHKAEEIQRALIEANVRLDVKIHDEYVLLYSVTPLPEHVYVEGGKVMGKLGYFLVYERILNVKMGGYYSAVRAYKYGTFVRESIRPSGPELVASAAIPVPVVPKKRCPGKRESAIQCCS